ncbi:MAG: glycoside hydrolase family 28 protein [Caulobacterales bacterium]|nr:glycoside hydrolase family 28 protein [Caulobacterales bacterium]
MMKLSRRQALIGSSMVAAWGLSGCHAGPLGGAASHDASGPESAADPWTRAQTIADAITTPIFPDRMFAITDHGAQAGEAHDSRPAVLAAIDACNAAGGGRVHVPAGLWRMDGPIHMKSDVELHLAEGAHMRFSGDAALYLPMVLTRWEGTEVYNYSPMIYGRGLRNVAITGPGKLDWQGAANFLPWRKRQKPDQNTLRQMGIDGVPVAERIFGEGHWLRPHFVQFFECEQVLVDGPTLVDSPFWMIHLVYCDNAVVRRVTCLSGHINSDGVDPDSSTNVLIEDCRFIVGDDGVAIKSGRDQDGWRVGRPSRNIVIRRCEFSGEVGGGFAIGSEMSGGVSDVFIEDCHLLKAKHALYFKANLDRGGKIERVYIRNITADVTDTVLIFTNDYHSYRGGQHPPRFEQVTVENVKVGRSRLGVRVVGHPDAPVRDVTVRDLQVDEVEIPVESRYVERLRFDNVRMNGAIVAMPQAG